jgi:GNAT superfamily N-acetyltransferase
VSGSPALIAEVESYARAGELRVAETGGRVVGALALGRRPGYAPEVAEPEVYLRCFVTARSLTGKGVGRLLLGRAEEEARARGAVLLRVDCWAGGGGALVDYYRRAGFEPVRRLGLSGWTGQLLQRRLPA